MVGRDEAPDPGTNGAAHDGVHVEDAEQSASAEAPGLFEAAARAGVQVAEIADHVGTLFQVRADKARLSVRRSLTRAALLLVAGAAVAVGVGAALVRVVAGIAGAITAAAGGRVWVGDLVGGALFLVLAAAGVAVGLRVHARAELRKKEAKYEERRRRHAERFGTHHGHETADGGGAARA
jgi:hypothetical protein